MLLAATFWSLVVLAALPREVQAKTSAADLSLSPESFEVVFEAQDPPRPERRRDRRRRRDRGGDRVWSGGGFTVSMTPPPLSPFEP